MSEVYNNFSKYFDNAKLTKLKDVNNYSMYLGKVRTMLRNENRYLVAFVNKDKSPLGIKKNLEELVWFSLSTRSLKEEHPNIDYIAYELKNDQFSHQKVYKSSYTKLSTTYSPVNKNAGFKVTILHQDDETTEEFVKSGILFSCIESYNTIITKI